MSAQGSLFGPQPGDHQCPTCAGTGRISDDKLRRMIADRPGAVRADATITSVNAARRPTNVVRFGTQRYRTLAVLASYGPATAAEVSVRVKLSRNQTATRLGELRDDGLVAYMRDERGDTIERPTGDNDTGLVQTITKLGQLALHRARP